MSKTKQPISKTKVLELRQADDLTATNGDWQTMLDSFTLNPGDSVILKTAIIDTTQTSLNKIVVADDLTLTINSIPYVVNYQHSNKTYVSGIDSNGDPTSATQPDHKRYFACELSNSGNHRVLKSVTFTASISMTKLKAFNFTINYRDPTTGTTTVYPPNGGHLVCPTTKAGVHTAIATVAVNLPIYDANTVPTINGIPPEINGPVASAKVDVGPSEAHGGLMSPLFLPVDVFLKKGSYDPTELCTVINDKLNSNNSLARVLDAPFLQSSADFGAQTVTMNLQASSTTVDYIDTGPSDFPLPIGTILTGNSKLAANTSIVTYDHAAKTGELSVAATGTGTGESMKATNAIYMVREDCTSADADFFSFRNTILNSANRPSLFGSSQVQLSVDQSSNQFLWKYLHQPYYDPASKDLSISYGPLPGGGTVKLASVGGVAISSLAAKVTATGVAADFWSGQLGFDLESQLNAGVALQISTSVASDFADVLTPVFSNVDASTTQQYIGADTVVQKGGDGAHSTTDQQFYAPDNSTALMVTADADSTVAVVAPTAYTELVGAESGYFKIEIEGIAHSEVVGSTGTSRTVQAIVTRFYTDTGNFCSAGSDSGIVYTHNGEPQTVSSLRCRILNPDSTIADVGPDNTVFLEVLKN